MNEQLVMREKIKAKRGKLKSGYLITFKKLVDWHVADMQALPFWNRIYPIPRIQIKFKSDFYLIGSIDSILN